MMLGCLASIDAIDDFLFISGFAPVNRLNLARYGINFVVDATNLPGRPSTGVDTLKVNVDDSELAQLKPFFAPVCSALERVRAQRGRALVHCAAGVSRSASLCIVFLMAHHRLPLRQAYFKVHEKRPIVAPNNGFWRQMIEFEQEQFGRQTVAMVKTRFREMPDVYLPQPIVARELTLPAPMTSSSVSIQNKGPQQQPTVLGYARLAQVANHGEDEADVQRQATCTLYT